MAYERPTWSDIYTTTEMAAALRMASARIAKNAGAYALAEEIAFAADCIEQLAAKAEALRAQIAALERHVDAGLATLEAKLQ